MHIIFLKVEYPAKVISYTSAKLKCRPFSSCRAAKHMSNETKLKSSSGGIFTALAEIILKEGGVVFGASFDGNWNVVHAYVENLEDLDKLRRSKYVQSDIGKTADLYECKR